MAIIRVEKSNPEFMPEGVQLLCVESTHLKKRADISVFNLHRNAENLPIVLLLHGVYGSHWVWQGLGGVQQAYMDCYNQGNLTEMILVMPSDGGFHSGSAYLPLSNGENYEKWITEDVIAAVIANNPAASAQSPIYISGLSMGGYGALRLGAKYPHIFAGISAHSAITHLSEMALFVGEDLSSYHCQEPHEAEILFWLRKHKDSLPPIRFDCGSEDLLYQGNLVFSDALARLGIKAELESLPGEHNWAYWHTNIAKTLYFFSRIKTS
jgi:putative tributyrin esterase